MKSFNLQYKNKKNLSNFIKLNNISADNNVLVQIFTGVALEEIALEVSSHIKSLIPNANIIGTTTAGEIYDAKIYEKTILISFNIFESTVIKSELFDFTTKTDIEQKLSKLVCHNTKALIVFSDRLKSSAKKLLDKLSSLYPHIVVAGGRAGYDTRFKKTFIFDENICLENGCAIASLSGDELVIHNDYMLNWAVIGRKMTVTKATKNIIYEIDDVKVQKVYEKYLGKDVSNNLLSTGAEFPLMTKRNGVDIARVPVSINEDDSLTLSGELRVGESVYFSYANIGNIKNSIYDNYSKLKKFPAEAIFIYSCVSRKNLIGEELESEFSMLNSLATTAGFFTNGEYFHSLKTNELLNMTTTFLMLSETLEIEQKKLFSDEITSNNTILKALTHLTDVTTKELEHKNRELQRLTDMTSKLVLYTTADLKGNITSVSKAYEKFVNKNATDIIGKNHNIFRHEETSDEFYNTMWETLDNDKRFVGEMRHNIDKKSDCWIKVTIEPVFDENNQKVGYSSYREDITKRKKLEFTSSHDSLTSLYNRGEFTKVINSKISSIKRHGGTFGFAMFDIDRFKLVNDTYGHKVGDDVLVKLSKIISSNIRTDDFIARWGGEEFVLILNNSNLEQLVILVEKLQKKLSEASFLPMQHITLSFGLTQYKDGDTKDSILSRADIALYSAKENGRDRYEIN